MSKHDSVEDCITPSSNNSVCSFKAIKRFWFFLFVYSVFFVIGQYASVVPVNLSWLLGDGWWVPLHVITVIPLVDISRSFSQYYAELAKMSFFRIFTTITMFSLFMSLLFTATAGLPINICLAAFLSVNLGGITGTIIFKFVERLSSEPYIRMLFSNLGATMVGGAIFFCIAYTNTLSIFFSYFGIFFENNHIMNNLYKGWAVQSIFIWLSGIPIAFLITRMISYLDRQQVYQ